jgi:hypothetical protein
MWLRPSWLVTTFPAMLPTTAWATMTAVMGMSQSVLSVLNVKQPSPTTLRRVHLDTQVFLFADGHVKSLRGTNNNPSNTQSISNAVWNGYTDFDTSGGDPTFNVSKQTNP